MCRRWMPDTFALYDWDANFNTVLYIVFVDDTNHYKTKKEIIVKMADHEKIKLLDNYQLYQILNNNSIDDASKNRIRIEFESRKIVKEEMNQIKRRYE